MKEIKLETVIKIAGLVFAAGVLYSNIKTSGEETRLRIQALQEKIEIQQKADQQRLQRIEDYLDALRRNHVL